MTADLSKFIQSIGLRLRGRNALIGCTIGALLVMFWLSLRDYQAHPTLSSCLAVGAFIAVVAVLPLAFIWKPRPEEVPGRAVVNVGRLGLYLASGLTSQNDMMEVIQAISGLTNLPAPSARVNGCATNADDYVNFGPGEAERFLLEIKESVKGEVTSAGQQAISLLGGRSLPTGTSLPQVEGKAEPPSEE